MAVQTSLKNGINKVLRPLNIRLDTWTADTAEQKRIATLAERGFLSSSRYPLTGGMSRFDAARIIDAYREHAAAIERLKDPAINVTGYTVRNDYFRTPDMEALYLMVRIAKPRRIVEIGSGNSTRISRQAIIDGHLDTELIAIDPYPRVDIKGLTDRFEQCRLEDIDDFNERFALGHNDILFIDSSHEVFVGNDVATVFCKIIPSLPPGVIVHVHDVFLPYDYPIEFARDYPQWGEQYLVHALTFARDCEVLWPGYHLQRDRHDLHNRLPFLQQGQAQSFWFRWS